VLQLRDSHRFRFSSRAIAEGVRLWCVSCGRAGTLTFEAIKAGDDEPFPTAGRRLSCSGCQSRDVQRMPDWP
jgi:hypothetical protein